MLAVATLAGGKEKDGERPGLDATEVLRTIAREAAAIGSGYEVLQCQADLQKATGQDGVPAVTPDIVGEAFVLAAFAGSRRGDGTGAVVRLGARAIPCLIRMAQDFAIEDVMSGTKVGESALVWLEALLADGEARDLGLVRAIDAAMPHETEVLRDAAVRVNRRLIESMPDSVDEAVNAERARLWNNLSVRLSDVGRAEDALEAAREAVELYRKLAAARPDAYLANLAGALNNWGAMLSAVGRAEDALEAAREAVEAYRKLPDAYLAGLARSLNNLGNRLSAVGRAEDALEAAREAVEIRRKLAAARPDAYLADLARSLNNWGSSLIAVGRAEDALEAAREAVEIRRKLAAARPDAYLGDLAVSLHNLGIRLSDVGRAEDALEAAREAVELYRKLAAARPDAYLAELAMSLNNWGKMLSAVGRAEDALEAARESFEIRRKLEAARPDAYGPDLARSLCVTAMCLLQLQRPAEAVPVAREAVATLRPHFLRNPGGLTPLMNAAAQIYRNACQAAEVEPDASLFP